MSQYFTEKNLVIGCALFGVLLQLIIVFFIIDRDVIFWPDSQKNYSIAKDLANGIPYSSPQYESNLGRAPGYPYFLSFVIRGVGSDITTLRIFHVLLFPFFIYAIYLLGKNIWDGRAGLIAAGISSVYPYFLYVPVTFYPESILIYLFVAIALAMVLARKNDGLLRVSITGVLIACAVMVRPTAIVWIPVVLFYLMWKRGFSLAQYAKTASLVILIPALAVSMWMYRNSEVHGAFMFTTKPTELLLNTYNENSRWDVKHPPMPERFVKKLRETKSLKEKQKFAVQEATEFIKNNPGRAFSIAGMQMLDLWNPIPRTIIEKGYGSAKFKIIPAILYAFVLILAIPAFIKYRMNVFVQSLLMLMLFNTALNGLFMISVRYRIITDFGLILLTALTLMSLVERFSLTERLSSIFYNFKKQ